MSQTNQAGPADSITVAAAQARIRLYPEAKQFRGEMSALIGAAMECSPDIIVLPEDIGTGLVALGTDFASRANSLRQAIVAVAIRNIAGAMPLLLHPSLSVPRALLLTLADRMREVYVSTFSDLAAEHAVYIAAGSLLLPRDDARDHRVYNRFFLFGPDGAIVDTAEKVNLIDLEAGDGLDLSAGAPDALSVWRTPIGNFAPVICYDAWDAPLVTRLVSDGAQMLLVPSANPEPWTEQVLAERREGMYARVRDLGVPGVEPFAVGSLAGLTFEGQSWILAPNPDRPDGVETVARAETAMTPEIISATVALPQPTAKREESASGGAGDAL